MRSVASGLVAIGIIFYSAAALAGAAPTCQHLPATGQTTSYGGRDDGKVQAGATQSFTDNHDGTITDNNTGLMWEKKVQGSASGYNSCTNETGTCANPHNADNAYSWSRSTVPQTAYNGTVRRIFLNQLNNRCNNNTAVVCAKNADCSVPGGPCGFAGHRNWRLPNVNELLSIIDRGTYSPALNVAFHGASCGPACTDLTDPACSCDASSYYWSASTYAINPSFAWLVSTSDGYAGADSKTFYSFVRAVRVGS